MKLSFVNTRVVYSTLFYVLAVILLIIAKPSFMYNADGTLREFGVGDDRTILSLGVFVVGLAILSFYMFCIIDLVFGQSHLF